MKNILIPTDFSETAENAAHYAAQLANIMNARLIFLNVFGVPLPMAEIPPITITEVENETMKLLHRFNNKIKAKHPKMESELHTEVGFAPEEIIKFTKNHKIDLIAMGVKSSGKLPGIFGSNVSSVIGQVTCPVLAIPNKCIFKKPQTIVVACDYKSVLPDKIIRSFRSFVDLFRVKLLLLNVFKPGEPVFKQKATAEASLENALRGIEHKVYFPDNENIFDEINLFIEQHHADILVMFPHKYNFFQEIRHHSATKTMAFLSHIPLLSIHE